MTYDDAIKAREYMLTHAFPMAEAKAHVTRAEARLRHIKALEMKASDQKSAAAQERDAYASDRYGEAIETLFQATVEAEKLKAGWETAKTTVDMWRTIESSRRAIG